MFAVGFNATDSTIVVDEEGRSLEAGAFGPVVTAADSVKEAADRGDLHVFPSLEAGPGQAEGAIAAIERVIQLRTAEAALAELEKDHLELGATAVGLDLSSSPDKPELVRMLAWRDVSTEQVAEAVKASEPAKPTGRRRSSTPAETTEEA